MNERIKQFADQILPNEKEFHQGNPKEWGYFFSGDELEKFAELIIRECAELADYYYTRTNYTRSVSGRNIKSHFGVE